MDTYEAMQPAANKLLNPDGSEMTYAGEILLGPDAGRAAEYDSRSPSANKFLNPDGSVALLREIMGSGNGGGGAGSPGPAGADGYTVMMSSDSWVFGATETAALQETATVLVTAYKGSALLSPHVASVTGMPVGSSLGFSGGGAINTGFYFTVGPSVTTRSGVLNVTITVDGKTFARKFSWALALKGQKGDSFDPADLARITALEDTVGNLNTILQNRLDGTGESTVRLFGTSYVYRQDTPSAVWVVQHNLGFKYVSVQVVGSGGELIWPAVDFTGDNAVTLTFVNPCSGMAIIRG